MEIQKTTWLIYMVDIAQILSAFGTTAAVIVAIWLARRAESQRLQFFSGVFAYTNEDNPALELYLQVTIVNSGVLPAVIKSTAFIFDPPDREWGWHFGPARSAEQFPLKLEHGQQVSAGSPFKLDDAPWDQIPLKYITARRMKFIIETSLGRTYVHRPNKMMLLAIKGNIQNARAVQST